MRPGGRWHTPEQCSFGLIDACRHGRDDVWFEYFFTRHHARTLEGGSYWQGKRAQPLRTRSHEFIAVARTRSPTLVIPPPDEPPEHRWRVSLQAVADALPVDAHGQPPRLVDACLVFPRLNDVRHTRISELQCPNVLYRQLNETHWLFEESRALPFKARPL